MFKNRTILWLFQEKHAESMCSLAWNLSSVTFLHAPFMKPSILSLNKPPTVGGKFTSAYWMPRSSFFSAAGQKETATILIVKTDAIASDENSDSFSRYCRVKVSWVHGTAGIPESKVNHVIRTKHLQDPDSIWSWPRSTSTKQMFGVI